MAQVIETYCDWCLERGEQVRGRTYRVGIGLAAGSKHPAAHDIDLCPDDAKPLAALLEAIEDKGRPIGRKPPGPKALPPAGSPLPETGAPRGTPGDLGCPVEGCDYSTTTNQRLASHVRRSHDMTLAEARGEPLPYRCDVCNKGLATPQGTMAHRASSHPDAPSLEGGVSELRVAS